MNTRGSSSHGWNAVSASRTPFTAVTLVWDWKSRYRPSYGVRSVGADVTWYGASTDRPASSVSTVAITASWITTDPGPVPNPTTIRSSSGNTINDEVPPGEPP